LPNLINLITPKVKAMEAKLRMQDIVGKKPTLRTQETGPKPCMRCQFGILDVPVDGKLNCLEAGTSNIKLLTKEEVENMMFCDKVVGWTEMVLDHKEAEEDSAIKLAEKILGKQ
jgi:hypothetical protein